MMTKKTLLIGAIVAALGAGAIGVGTTLAAEEGRKNPEFVSELVTAIAEKFDLDPEAVQEVFDEQAESHREEMQAKHEEMRAKHDEMFEERLAQAVENEELTQDQADEILEKREEMQAYAETLKDMEPEERKGAMQEQVDALNEWAEENDIPTEYVRFGPPPRGQNGQGGMGMGMHRPDAQPPVEE